MFVPSLIDQHSSSRLDTSRTMGFTHRPRRRPPRLGEAMSPLPSEFPCLEQLDASGCMPSDDVLCAKNTISSTTSLSSIDAVQRKKPISIEVRNRDEPPDVHSPVRFCSDEGGIYKGRTNHRDRVREIDDNRDTKVEVPVEHRRIETIEDEDVYGDPKANRRRQPPLSTQSFSDTRQKPARVRSPLLVVVHTCALSGPCSSGSSRHPARIASTTSAFETAGTFFVNLLG